MNGSSRFGYDYVEYCVCYLYLFNTFNSMYQLQLFFIAPVYSLAMSTRKADLFINKNPMISIVQNQTSHS